MKQPIWNLPTNIRGTKPADGTSPIPFTPASGSERFRIPALYTMEDGTLFAAADARWNTYADGCGLDTIVSRSDDNGASWHYTFANYLPDNGNTVNIYSTAFIDPAILTRGDSLYLLVDLWPGSVALNSTRNRPVPGTGYDQQGRLLLKQSTGDRYDWYLGNFGENGFAKIFRISDDAPVSGYTVDRWFHLYYNGLSINSNLFYFDAPYRVCPTSFLYLTESRDKGKTWFAPLLLNPMVKNADEPFYGTGPGRGLVTESGRMIFPCYYHIYGKEGTSLIYSDDGKTWRRTPTLCDASSESQLVELSNGAIRAFFRNRLGRICYADARPTDDGYVWGQPVLTDVKLKGRSSACMIAAMGYPTSGDGCDLMFVACPSNTGDKTEGGGRYNGILRAMKFDPATGESHWCGAMELNGPEDFYGYSCLTVLGDGRLALLYESESDVGFTFVTYKVEDILE